MESKTVHGSWMLTTTNDPCEVGEQMEALLREAGLEVRVTVEVVDVAESVVEVQA